MDRYSDYARDVRKIPNVESFSSRATILPLREFPLKCDTRRSRSYQNHQDIERSREDQPLLAIPAELYKLRRIVVPPTRSQYIEPSRIPNARDPRGLHACRKFNAKSKKWKYVPNWVPTLVENDEVLQEEETCAVLLIDVSEWESRGMKRSYIEVIPHECNVQRSAAEVQRQLIELEGAREDELLMTPEEAREVEKNIQATRSNEQAQDDSDIEECNSDGEVLPKEAPATFDAVEDRPMLEINEEQAPVPSNLKAPIPSRTDEDEDEDNVIYEADKEPDEPPVPRLDDTNVECIDIDTEQSIKKEPQVPPAPTPDDADVPDVECINLDSDEEHPIVPKKEPPPPIPRSDDADVVCIDLDSDEDEPVAPKKEAPQEAHVPFDKNLPVLDEVTIDDSEDDDCWDLVAVAKDISKRESETNKSKNDNNNAPTCSDAEPLSVIDAREDSLGKSAGLRTGESNEDYGQQVTEVDHNGSTDHCVEQNPEMTIKEAGCIQNRDCDSDLPDTVISECRPVENHEYDEAVEQTENSVGFGFEVPETSDIADEADRSSDSDSDMPTTMQFETLADVHEEPVRDKSGGDDVIAHSEISQMQQDTEEAAQRANIHVSAANITQKRKRIDSSERFDVDMNELHAITVVAVEKRRKENYDDSVNDENQSDNCFALVERAPSPVFTALPRRRNKRARIKPSKNVLQLSSTSTCAINKPSAWNRHRSILFSNFSAIGILKEYLKNYTATYNCINFFAKNYENLTVFEILRVSENVKRNNDFWRNRYNHWHREENNVIIEDITERNQLAMEPAHPFMNSQGASVCEVQPKELKTVIEEAVTTSQSEQSYSTRKDMINVTGNSWLVRGNSKEDDFEKIKSHRRHSLPMVTMPQQSFGVKRPRSGSSDNPIKLTLKRSQADVSKWISTSNTSKMPKISVQCTLSHSNNSAKNALEQIIPNKHVDSITNKACVSVNKVLPKWSFIDKEVPELDLDDLANRPLPQKIQFDMNKLCLNLQNKVKKRTISVDSAIVSDIEENSCKRTKLTDSTKEKEQSIESIYTFDDDGFSCNDNIGESLEITALPPDSRTELLKPQSENVFNLNNNNNEDTFKNSEEQMSFILEILPKDCPQSTVALGQNILNVYEKNTPYLENINQDFQDDSSSASDSSFHLRMEDEYDDPSNTAQSQDSNIQIDHNCNLQKDVNSFDEPCNETFNTRQNETNLNKNSEKQVNLNNHYTKKVDRLNKRMETLFGESNIDEVEEMVAMKYNYKKCQTDELEHTQKDGRSDNSMERKLQNVEEKQPTDTVEQSCIKDSQISASNSTESELITTINTNEEQQQQIYSEKDAGTNASHEKEFSMSNKNELALESGLMTTVTTNEEQQQEIFGEKDAGTDAALEKDNHIEISMNNKKKLTVVITSLDNQDKIITGESSTTSDLQGDSPKNVGEHEDCFDVQNNQALINTEKQIESHSALESESDLLKDNQNSVIFNEKVDSDVFHSNINDDAEHPASKDEEMVENEKRQENSKNSSEDQETSDIIAPSSSSNQDQGHLEIIGLEDGLEEGDLDFHTSIHGVKTNYSGDDYDVNSDDEEYENQATMEHLKDVSVHKSNESSVPNENTDTSDCVSNILKKDSQSSTIETEGLSTSSEDEHLHNSQKSPLKITNDDPPKSNWNNFTDGDEEDDDIIIEYENINNDSNHSNDVKPDLSNINNDLDMHVSETSDLQVPNVENTVESQSTEQKIVSPALLPESNLHDKDSSVELAQLQTESSTEAMDCSEKSSLENSVPDTAFLPSSSLNNSSTSTSAIEVPASSESNDRVSSASISINSTLIAEPTIQSSANVGIDFNNRNILEKFNLTREIVAPEDIKAEHPVAFENNDEEQVLCNTLENMMKEDSGKECEPLTFTNEQKNSSIEVPSTSSLAFEVALPTGPQCGNNYNEMLKALNVNVDNEVDIIVDRTMDKNSAPGIIKVKNLNDMLMKKVSNPSPEEATSGPQAFLGNPSPNVQENIQQNTNYHQQEQSRLPVNMFLLNNPVPNASIFQPPPQPPPPYPYIVNQPLSAGVQPLVNMYNLLPGPVPIMNNVGQHPVHFPNINLLNQVPMQNNVQISALAPAAVATSDKNIVLASSMFPNIFDAHPNSSFISKTVFSLQLLPLPNIILPPPYTILPSHDQSTISNNIQAYKSKLLRKLIKTLKELEDININAIRRQVEVLRCKQTLTEETWKIQKKMLTIAQCVGSFKKLTTEKNYSNIIEAIMGSIYTHIRDDNLLKKLFGIFQNLKENGIFRPYADAEQPLGLELGAELRQTAIGMSSSQKELLKYQIRIYREMLKINHKQIQSNRVAQPSIQTKNQNPVQRSSPMALQQNIVTTTVSSPVTDIANNSFQYPANIKNAQFVSTESLPELTKEQRVNEKEKSSIQKATHSKAFANKCDISKICLRCGKPSLFQCMKCLNAVYCSSTCQDMHWKVEHSTSCKPVNSAS